MKINNKMNLKLIKNLQKVKDEFVNNGYRLSRATVRDFYNVVCCSNEPPEPELPINFDITSTDWIGINESDFIIDLNNSLVTDVIINNFTNTNGRIQCNLETTSTFFNLTGLNITDVKIVNINNLQHLYLRYNQIVDFNPTIPLPNSLQYLDLESNLIVDFNPTIPLPNSLQELNLKANRIVSLNNTMVLSSSLPYLNIQSNLIVNWSFSESWANSAGTQNTELLTYGNPTSSNSTTFKSILQGKGWTVYS